MKLKRENIKYIIEITSLVLIDQIIKILIYANKQFLPVQIVNKILNINYEENFGVAFGIAKGGLFIFIIINLVIIGVILKMLFKSNQNQNNIKKICFILISAGGIGNLIDRIFRGYVIDYIDFSQIIDFPIFNFADICIVIGTIGIAVYTILEIIKEKE